MSTETPSGSLDEQLLHLIQLDGDWDSYGGAPIDRRAIARCRSLHFSPTSEGGVQVELTDGTHLVEVNISPEGKLVGVSMEQP